MWEVSLGESERSLWGRSLGGSERISGSGVDHLSSGWDQISPPDGGFLGELTGASCGDKGGLSE